MSKKETQDYVETHSFETATLLDTLNNDTGDWLSGEMDCPAETLIQSIHNAIGEFYKD